MISLSNSNQKSKIIQSIDLTFGSVAKIHSDGDVMLEFDNLSPYFVLTKEDLDVISRNFTNETIVSKKPVDYIGLKQTQKVAKKDRGDEDRAMRVNSAIAKNGFKATPIYEKIFTVLNDFNGEMSAKDICEKSHIGVSKTTISERLNIMERCGLVKRTKSGTGIATLWITAPTSTKTKK